MILEKVNDKPVCCVIDLKDLRSCWVKKTYGSINAGGLKRKKLEEFLSSISLQPGFKEKQKQLSLISMNSSCISPMNVRPWKQRLNNGHILLLIL